MLKRSTLLLLLGTLSAGMLSAQTVQWAVRPTSAQIENYGSLLKVKKGGKCGLVNLNEQEIVPVAYDSISPFRDGYALVMNKAGNQLRIEGLLSEGDNEMLVPTETVYATRYMWFSDGKMPVKGAGGWGYLGTDGNMAIPCQFQFAYPFSEGYASVMLNDKAYYINRFMDYLPVEAGYGNLVFASTFSGQEAVVYSGDSYTPKGYVINRKGRILRQYKVKPADLKINKDDHSVGDKSQLYMQQVQQASVDNSYEVYQEDGLYGYKKNGAVVLPAQLDKAEPVRGEYANVQYKGQNGVLQFQEGSFSQLQSMEFVYDQYAHWHVSWRMLGLMFNNIPYVRHLKWREVVTFRGVYGKLSEKNDPDALNADGTLRNPNLFRLPSNGTVYRLGNTPYMEVSFGLENIFKVLRIEYIRRLTYLDHPGIRKNGAQATIVLSF